MDIPAVKPASSVATAPTGKGRSVVSEVNSGKDLPPPPPPAHARLDPVVMQQLDQKKAAVAQQMSKYLRANSRNLDFQIDSASGEAVVTVRDASGNVVRRIPGEDALQLLRRANVESGTFIDSLV
jgi:hypothetical protein